jgi:hypothetical protein
MATPALAPTPPAKKPYPVKVYATGQWSEAGTSMKQFIAELDSLGFDTYDWTVPEHYDRPFPAQHIDIVDALEDAVAFVFVLGDPVRPDSSSCLQLGHCLLMHQLVIFVDPMHGKHTPGENGGAEGYHNIISNVHALSALATGKMFVVPTKADTVTLLQRLQWPSTLVFVS